MVHQFGLRDGSAGVGKWHGGEGVIREIEFLEPLQVSILSEVSLGVAFAASLLRTNTPAYLCLTGHTFASSFVLLSRVLMTDS